MTKSLLRGINAENNVYIEPFSLESGEIPKSQSETANLKGESTTTSDSGQSKSDAALTKKKKRSSSKAPKRQNEFTKIFQNDLPQEERLIADFR